MVHYTTYFLCGLKRKIPLAERDFSFLCLRGRQKTRGASLLSSSLSSLRLTLFCHGGCELKCRLICRPCLFIIARKKTFCAKKNITVDNFQKIKRNKKITARRIFPLAFDAMPVATNTRSAISSASAFTSAAVAPARATIMSGCFSYSRAWPIENPLRESAWSRSHASDIFSHCPAEIPGVPENVSREQSARARMMGFLKKEPAVPSFSDREFFCADGTYRARNLRGVASGTPFRAHARGRDRRYSASPVLRDAVRRER